MSDAAVRAQALERLHKSLRACTQCDLCIERTQVVVGAGDPDANLMFVGEAPGANEDRTGMPFVGQAGTLLESLLEGIGLTRDQVFITNVLKCRPPGNRDPVASEIHACQRFLADQVSLVRPRLVCTLGNFATKLISGRPDGISTVHGTAQKVRFAGVDITLVPRVPPRCCALHTVAAWHAAAGLRADSRPHRGRPRLGGATGGDRASGRPHPRGGRLTAVAEVTTTRPEDTERIGAGIAAMLNVSDHTHVGAV